MKEQFHWISDYSAVRKELKFPVFQESHRLLTSEDHTSSQVFQGRANANFTSTTPVWCSKVAAAVLHPYRQPSLLLEGTPQRPTPWWPPIHPGTKRDSRHRDRHPWFRWKHPQEAMEIEKKVNLFAFSQQTQVVLPTVFLQSWPAKLLPTSLPLVPAGYILAMARETPGPEQLQPLYSSAWPWTQKFRLKSPAFRREAFCDLTSDILEGCADPLTANSTQL